MPFELVGLGRTHTLREIGSYDELLATVRERFSLGADRPFVITDMNRRQIGPGDLEVGADGAKKTLLVLDSVDAELHGVASHKISYQPHYRTLTDGGNAHFSDPAYAVADLVDNSIQATQEAAEQHTGSTAMEKRVEVSVFLADHKGVKGGKGYLVVYDNGCGMDDRRIKAFATYFWDQEDRGLAPTEHSAQGSLTGKISKFGVGAIHAGFFIGSRIKVISKTKDSVDVRCFTMDKEELKRRSNEGSSALYEDHIQLGDRSLEWAITEEERKFQGLMKMLQDKRDEPHFTFIVLTIQREHATAFRSDAARTLTKKLAHMYHYYANPQTCPAFDLSTALTQGAIGKKRSSASQPSPSSTPVSPPPTTKRRRIGQNGEATLNDGVDNSGEKAARVADAKKKEVTLVINYSRDPTKDTYERTYDLKEQSTEMSLEVRFLERAKSAFRFSAELDGSPPVERLRESSEAEVDTQRKKFKVNGILYYYPFENYMESRPTVFDDVIEINSDSEDEETATMNRESEPIFQVFWQGRLIPESVVYHLSFFPSMKAQWNERLPRFWRRRIHGTLFFDDWRCPVSTNKLRLLFAPSLHEVMNDKARITLHKRNLQDDFLEWLSACHRKFDKEVLFCEKIGVEPNGKHTLFAAVRHGLGEDAVYKAGEKVKLFMKPAGGARNLRQVYGTITHFVVSQDVTTDTYSGDGDIVFKRHPEEVFGSDDLTEPLKTLVYDQSRVSSSEWDQFAENMRRKRPSSIVVLTFDEKTKTRKPLLKRFTSEVGVTMDILNVLVGVVDGDGEFIKTKAAGQGQPIKVVEEATGPEACRYESTKPSQEGKFHVFKPWWNSKPGEYKLRFSVWEDGKEVLSSNYTYTIRPSQATSFVLEGPDNGSKEVSIAPSIPVPGFRVLLKDKEGNNTTADTVTIRLESDDLTFSVSSAEKTTKRGKAPRSAKFVGSVQEVTEGILFDDGDWTAAVKGSGPLIGSDTISSKTLRVKVLVEEFPSCREDFELLVQPGAPTELRLLSPDIPEGGLVVENMTVLPELVVAPFDCNGNLTGPSRGESWCVNVEGDAVQPASAAQHKVGSEGRCNLHDIQVQVEWPEPVQGEEQPAQLTDKAVRLVLQASGQTGRAASIDVPLVIKPSKRPSTLEIYQDGKPLALGKVVAGTLLTELEVRVLNQQGEVLTIEPAHLEGKNLGLKASWATKKTATVFPKLPDLTADTKVSDDPKVHQIILTLSPSFCLTPLIKEFSLRVVPGPPVAWEMRGLSEFICGVPLQSEVTLFQTDAHGNTVFWNSKEMPIPELLLIAEDVRDEPDEWMLKFRKKEGGFQLPMGLTLTGPVQEAHFSIADTREGFEMRKFTFQLVSGPPVSVQLRVPPKEDAADDRDDNEQEEEEPAFQEVIEMSLHPGASVSGLQLRVVDSGGNAVTEMPAGCAVLASYDDSDKAFQRVDVPPGALGEAGVISIPPFTYKANTKDKKLDRTVQFMLRVGAEKMGAATLLCKTYLLNSVKGIRLSWDHLGLRDPTKYLDPAKEGIKVDQKLPNLIVYFITDDGKPFIPDAGSYKLSVAHKSRTIEFREMFHEPEAIEPEKMEGKRVLEFKPKADFELSMGTYEVGVFYEEYRESIKSALSQKSHVVQKDNALSLSVVAGEPVRIMPKDGGEHVIQGKVVTCRSDRTILEPLTLAAVDAKGNNVFYNEPLSMTIRWAGENGGASSSGGGADRSPWPVLQGADDEGRVVVKSHNGEYKCGEVKLAEHRGTQDGLYELVFEAEGLEPWVVEFTFAADSKRQKEINEVVSKVERLKRKRQERSEKLSKMEGRKKKAEDNIKQIYSQLPKFSDIRRLFVSDITQGTGGTQDIHFPALRDVQSEINKATKTLNDMKAEEMRRPRVPPTFPKKECAEFKYKGAVVQLGYVKDNTMARLLSHYVGPKLMGAYVFENKEDQKACGEKCNVPTFSIETLIPFYVHDTHGQKRTRNKKEMEQGRLPLTVPQGDGNPRYAVNLIELPEDQESLRDTLFNAIFGRTLIFDTMNHALKYRSKCKERLQQCGPIATEDGWRISSSGLLEKDPLPEEPYLRFMFGDMPVQQTRTYKCMQRDLDQLQKLVEPIGTLEEAVKELEDLEQDPEDHRERSELLDLRGELSRLQSQPDDVEDSEDDRPLEKPKKKRRKKGTI